MVDQNNIPIAELFNLKGRVAVVTGGAGKGYGAQAVTALAECGATVLITSRDLSKSEKKASQYQTKDLDVYGYALELGDEKSVNEFVSSIIQKHGRIDILVNNATENDLCSFEDISVEHWNNLLTANLTGTMLLTREIGKHMLKAELGSIINISSIYGIAAPDQRIYGDTGLNSPLLYGIVKAGLIQMSRYLASYWAPHIRCNTISPGGLHNDQGDDFVTAYTQRTPLSSMAGPNDLKGVVAFLASDASSWVTGQNYIVDGGWTAW